MAATNSGTIHRFSIYGTTFNGNIIARSLMAATDSSTKLRFSIYKTTINGNILARSVIAATNSGTIPRVEHAKLGFRPCFLIQFLYHTSNDEARPLHTNLRRARKKGRLCA